MKKKIALLSNPKRQKQRAGRMAREIAACLERKSERFEFFDAHWPPGFDDFSEVWLVGGDGTMNYFLNAYPTVNIPLALFPGGTGNDWHWMMYGDLNLERQIDIVLNAEPRQVDLGICNGRKFINGVGIGFDGKIVCDLLERSKTFGKFSYWLSVFKNILRYREAECSIGLDGKTSVTEVFLLSIANGRRYGGSFMVAPWASMNDGLADIVTIGKINPIDRIRYLPRMERGQHMDLAIVKHQLNNRIHVAFAKPMHAHLDGEYMRAASFDIQILPAQLRFLY